MSNTFTILPDDSANTGKKIQQFANTVSANTVQAQAVALVTSAGASIDAASGNAIAVGGNANSGASDSGAPVKAGGVYNATLPTLTTGQRGDLQEDSSARLIVTAGDKAALAQSLNVTSTTNRVSLALEGAGTALVTITGNTWTGTVTFEVQGDGTNWLPVVAIPISVTTGLPGTPVSTVTSPAATVQFLVPCAGYSAVGVHCTSVGSNTATVSIVAGVGSSATVGLVQGNVAAGATDTGAAIKVGAPFVNGAALPTYTTGQRGDLQVDQAGTLKVGAFPLGTTVTDSHTAAASAVTCTLTGVASKFMYLEGFTVTGLGATSAASIQITTTGLTTNLTYTLPIPAGATVGVTPLDIRFPRPIPASAVNTSIVIVVPSFGSGNTVASASAYGFAL